MRPRTTVSEGRRLAARAMRWGLGVAVLAACRPAAGANAKQTGAVVTTSEGASLRKLGEV